MAQRTLFVEYVPRPSLRLAAEEQLDSVLHTTPGNRNATGDDRV
jgi:hypothetical protein